VPRTGHRHHTITRSVAASKNSSVAQADRGEFAKVTTLEDLEAIGEVA
jgi:hypothetical protein